MEITNNKYMTSFYLIVIYLFFEYGRPQNLLPLVGSLHIPAIVVFFILVSLIILHKISFKDKQTIMILFILCEMVINGPIAKNNYWAFMIFYNMCITFIAYLGIIGFVDTYSKYDKLIQYWIVIFIFLAIIGMTNKGKGIGGFIGDENDFCMALNMILPFVTFGLFMDRSKIYKIYCLLLSFIFLFVIILTQSRGGFVGLLSVVVYCWLRSNKKIALGIIVGILSIFMFFIAPSEYWEEMGTISQEASSKDENLQTQSGTGAQRVYSWKLSWRMFLDNPILGVGQGNYPWNVVEQEEKMKMQWRERSLGGRAAHSLYFTLLPELGIVGVILFLIIVWYIFKDLKWIRSVVINKNEIQFKNIYYTALALEGSLLGFLTSSVFISTLYYPSFWILCALVVSFKNVVKKYIIPSVEYQSNNNSNKQLYI